MDYADYVSNISFRFAGPHSRLGGVVYPTLSKSARLGRWFELLNTVLPEGQERSKTALGPLLDIPRMSTFAIAAIINRGVAELSEEHAFVNVGVWNGFTLLAGMTSNREKLCIGVDNFTEFGGPREEFLERFNARRSAKHSFYDMDYRKYFSTLHKDPIGYYVYDASHDYESQLTGLRLAEPFFADGCTILVDDTNLSAPRQAAMDFVARSKSRYDVILDRTTCRNGHPTFWNGVMMLRRIG